MKILILNSGSSSLKYKLFQMPGAIELLKGHIDGIGLPLCAHICDGQSRPSTVANHEEAVQLCLSTVQAVCPLPDITATGHRVVHGGEYFKEAALITDVVVKRIEELCGLAPLHNPPNVKGIQVCRAMMPATRHIAVFDTAFHQSLAPEAFLYGIPYEHYQTLHVRKYGFHGTSHKYVANKVNEFLKKDCKTISCHLGNGASVTAIRNMKSVDTTMGFTPLQGLVMGTRTGDLDPGIIQYLIQNTGMDIADIMHMLNNSSGLKGICGYSDMREIHEHALQGDAKAQLAIDLFVRRVVHYIGAYDTLLEGADAIVFTAGMGENAPWLRKMICDRLSSLGVELDEALNDSNSVLISKPQSGRAVLIIPTNEEEQIAQECYALVKG